MPRKGKSTPEYDSERETRVLLEKIGSDVKTVAEQHGSIKAEINQLRNSMESRFDMVEAAVMENSRGLKRVEQRFDNVDQRLGNVEQKLDTTLADHEQRIKKVEEKVGAV